ncbi:hypothetical protein NQ317_013594 [Molorchus minor]|uniref:Uncharacterized protein n=1 Tax=Molorchus minor TaxID=1323400 RepID=A0ABQ9J6Q7_9CUCU|nr:hypothetical protein NQ317_013594 [Molorchus minor]
MRSPTNFILIGLAVADLLVMLEYIPFTVHRNLDPNRKFVQHFSYGWALFYKFRVHNHSASHHSVLVDHHSSRLEIHLRLEGPSERVVFEPEANAGRHSMHLHHMPLDLRPVALHLRNSALQPHLQAKRRMGAREGCAVVQRQEPDQDGDVGDRPGRPVESEHLALRVPLEAGAFASC